MTENPDHNEEYSNAEQESCTTAIAPLPPEDLDEKANKIIKSHVMWSMGAGLVPIPLADIASVTAIQMDALKQLAELHEVEYTEANGKRFAAALVGGLAARVGASAFKAIPGVGSIIGGLSMSAMSGASTFALCQVADKHFRTHGDFLEVDWDDAKDAYKVALKKGKEMVKSLEAKINDSGATRPEEEVEENTWEADSEATDNSDENDSSNEHRD